MKIKYLILIFILLDSCEDHILCMSLHADHAMPFLVVKSFSEEEMYDPRYL